MRTIGVEEEFLLVDARHEHVAAVASEVLRVAKRRGDAGGPSLHGQVAGALVHEFLEQQIEAYTSPHRSMSMLEEELRCWRAKASSAAEEVGARIVASATPPVAVVPRPVRNDRFDLIDHSFSSITGEQLACGCHVHVSVDSPQEAVGVLDRIRGWLPVLLALSANSPFWQGHDTGCASYRSQLLSRWPVSGPTDVYGSVERHREVMDALVDTGVILDEGMVYFDARCSRRYPTVEIRMPDVCLDVRDAVMVAALSRALVDTAAQEWADGRPAPPMSAAVLRLATWQAARSGVDAGLLDPLTSRLRPAKEVVHGLFEHVRPALGTNHDEDLVARGIDRVLVRGSGARLQRSALDRTGSMTGVLRELERATRSQLV